MRRKPQIGPIRCSDNATRPVAKQQRPKLNRSGHVLLRAFQLRRHSCGGVCVCVAASLRPERRHQEPATSPPRPSRPTPPRKPSARSTSSPKPRRLVNGPAGNPECVWLGRRVVGLLWRDDMDTAFRHLDLYDRFGCPGPAYPGGVPLRRPPGQQYRPEIAPEPQCPGACLLAEPDCLAGRERPPGRAARHRPAAAPAPAAQNSGVRASRRRNRRTRKRVKRRGVAGRRPSSIRHELESIVLWPLTRYAASQQWPTQGTGWVQTF